MTIAINMRMDRDILTGEHNLKKERKGLQLWIIIVISRIFAAHTLPVEISLLDHLILLKCKTAFNLLKATQRWRSGCWVIRAFFVLKCTMQQFLWTACFVLEVNETPVFLPVPATSVLKPLPMKLLNFVPLLDLDHMLTPCTFLWKANGQC